MKDLHDLVRGWIEKADSDLKTTQLLIKNGKHCSPASKTSFLKDIYEPYK